MQRSVRLGPPARSQPPLPCHTLGLRRWHIATEGRHEQHTTARRTAVSRPRPVRMEGATRKCGFKEKGQASQEGDL